MSIVNPEFRRYLWLNFSPFRLTVMPILLALVIYCFSSFGGSNWHSDIFAPTAWTFVIAVFLWGNYEAANSTAKDVGMNTWDFQKMSALSPMQLTLGKLFGATSYAWYAGLLLLLVLMVLYPLVELDRPWLKFQNVYETPIMPAIYLLFAGVIGHATSLLCSVNSLRYRKRLVLVFHLLQALLCLLRLVGLSLCWL